MNKDKKVKNLIHNSSFDTNFVSISLDSFSGLMAILIMSLAQLHKEAELNS